MKGFALSPAAAADMDSIWDYTAEHWSVDQADQYTDEIRDVCRDLAEGRKKGRTVEVRAGYLKYAVSAHMVYFRDRGDRIEIIRILHGRMDANRHL